MHEIYMKYTYLNYGPASDQLLEQVVIEGPLELPLVDRCVLPGSDRFLW